MEAGSKSTYDQKEKSGSGRPSDRRRAPGQAREGSDSSRSSRGDVGSRGSRTDAEEPAWGEEGGSDDERPNKVRRIGRHTRGLFDDLTGWVELRLRLFQLDVQERVQKKVDEALSTAALKGTPIIVGLVTVFFALVTMALFAGWALGHPAWGFLIVTGLLGLVTAGMFVRSRRLDREKSEIDVTDAGSTDRKAHGIGSPPTSSGDTKKSMTQLAEGKSGGLR